jgi:K+-sensing histidine kinase KdpD
MILPLICVVLAILLVARDLVARRTERRLRAEMSKLKEGLKDTDRLANVGRLVSGLAQELKSPLQGVLGNAEVLAATTSGQTSAAELQEIRENATRAVGIVRNLLVFTEANSLNRRWQNLNDLVNTALDSRRSELTAAGVRVSLDGAQRLPLVYVDGRQLERVITTLLDRWIKGAKPKGAVAAVAISTQHRSADERLIVSIDDPSTLLDEDDATWSGDLDACRRVLETHGGALEIERRPAGGFACRLELPVTAAAEAAGSVAT